MYLNFSTYNFLLAFIQNIKLFFQFFLSSLQTLFLFFIYHPIFQDLNDTVYSATILTVNMISMILMDFRFLTSKLTPVVIFVVSIICFVFFLILYNILNRRIMMKYSKKMFTTYKHSRACLPPTTLLVFTTPMPTQSLLSHEAYTVMQAFSSLGITTKREHHYYMFVGTYKKMPALKNIDFIKWGLNYFHDTESLIICAQICQYFTDKSQTQAVLIQKLNETNDISFFMEPAIFNLVLYHADSISDKPAFLKKLQKKAYALSIFWGCVLKHSSNCANYVTRSMKHASILTS